MGRIKVFGPDNVDDVRKCLLLKKHIRIEVARFSAAYDSIFGAYTHYVCAVGAVCQLPNKDFYRHPHGIFMLISFKPQYQLNNSRAEVDFE